MEEILVQTLAHIKLSVLGVALGIIIGVPLGILIANRPKMAQAVMKTTEVLQTIPVLAMLALLMMILGLGDTTLVVALFLYSLLPIVRNTYTAIKGVDSSIVQAGLGMGMTRLQLLQQVQIPLAMPIILAGIRVALVTAIGITTLGTFIGAGGLGNSIWMGMKNIETQKGVYMILSGAIPAALLAIIFELGLAKFEDIVTPRGLKTTNLRRD